MTIAASNTAELTIDQLIHQALMSVGMMPFEQAATGSQWNARAAAGRTELQLILAQLEAKQFFVRQVENYTLTVATGDGAEATPISLPADTLDVVGDAMWLDSGATVEFPVKQVDQDFWHRYADKVTTGRPSFIYVSRLGTVKLFLIQPPGTSETGATLRLRRQKLLANMVQAGSSTPDLERTWQPYLKWKLAEFFAGGSLPAQAALARANAQAAYSDAVPAAKNRGNQRMIPGRW